MSSPEPVPEDYPDLVAELQRALENSWQLDAGLRAAYRAGDPELAGWLRRTRDENLRASVHGKVLLAHRLHRESS